MPDTSADTTYITMADILKDNNKSILELHISKYVDSINNSTNEEELPYFLSDSQFDYKNRGIWTSFHNPISVRSQIINRVNNCKALLLIIYSQNPSIKSKPALEDGFILPAMEFSFYDLALKRVNVLECK